MQNKRTPLHWACENGHTATVEMLLLKGAELDAKDKARWSLSYGSCSAWPTDAAVQGMSTPLHWACENGHTATVEILLNKGAELDANKNVSLCFCMCLALTAAPAP